MQCAYNPGVFQSALHTFDTSPARQQTLIYSHLVVCNTRAEVRTLIEALVTSQWFPGLPGATRLAVVQEVVQDMARRR